MECFEPIYGQDKLKLVEEEFKNSISLSKQGIIILIKHTNSDINTIMFGKDEYTNTKKKLTQGIIKILDNTHNASWIKLNDHEIISILQDFTNHEVRLLSDRIFNFSQLDIYKSTKVNIDLQITSIKYPEFGTTPENLLKKLVTSTVCKECSNYYIEYQEKNNKLSQLKNDHENLSLLKEAIIKKQVSFVYQPILECKSNDIIYYECLLRIPNKHGEVFSVGPLIKSAEQNSLINIIDRMVLDMVIEELKNSRIKLSINISHLGVSDLGLHEYIKKLLYNKEIASRLVIEITETACNLDYDYTRKFIDLIHSLGSTIAIDDFGSGYTSFMQLNKLPIDIIKIDGHYIKNIFKNTQNRVLVETLIKIAESIGAKTVAEYVESSEIAEYLKEIKIHGMQGNYFSPATKKKDWKKI